MTFIARARPTEHLVISRRGRLRHAGLGGHAWLWPGADYIVLPAVKQEATFAMTQESCDGIPLRFKGIVVFAVTDPVRAATCFDFTTTRGLGGLRDLIAHVCLGELRDRVSHLSMAECIEQRKTTLSSAVREALAAVACDEKEGWGIAIDLVQVAQVFIVDDELRTRLEAEIRNEVDAKGELSRIDKDEAVQVARLESERRLARQALELDRERHRVEEERLVVDQALSARRLELAGPQRRAELEDERQTLEAELEPRRLANEVRDLEVQANLMQARAEAAIERQLLPIRQLPDIATALSRTFQGTNLSFYGSETELLRTLQPLVDRVMQGLEAGGARAVPDGPLG